MTSHSKLSRAAGFGAALVTLCAFLLAACGGGGTSSSPKTSMAAGPISGFGSIIVNGVHYNESKAVIKDEDGGLHSPSELKLGMTVEVDAGEIEEANNVQSATAQEVTFSSLIRGPVESVGTDSVVVLGQTVKVTSATAFDDSLNGGLAALQVGAVVRVYGMLEAASGSYTATRIEPESGAEPYRLRGAVAAYDAVGKTIKIGGALIDVSTVSLPDGLKVGSLVRVTLQTTKLNGAWVAISVKSGLFQPQDDDHAEVEGIITDLTSLTSFSVDGLPVDASKATFPDGTAEIVKGARVEVEGAVVNGVLVATKVEPDSDAQAQAGGFDVEGAITSVDTVKSTFVVHGVTVSYAGSVTFSGGTAASLQPGAFVEVHGMLAADGVTLNATAIRIVP